MGSNLVTGPALEPITLVEGKAHLRVSSEAEDGLIAGYILAARSAVESYTRRAMITQTWEATLDYSWPTYFDKRCGRHIRRVVLPRPPTQSVASITYVDTEGATQTLASNQYKVAKIDTGEWVIDQAYGVTWPPVRSELAAITVRFIAGYGDQPGAVKEELRQAMLLLLGHFHENREAVISVGSATELPLGVKHMIDPYRVFY